MKTNLDKGKGIFKKKSKKIEIELIRTIIETTKDLNIANKNFEIAEEELIDYYSYQIKANKAKLDYLIKEVKKRGIVLDMINDLKLRIYSKKEVI